MKMQSRIFNIGGRGRPGAFTGNPPGGGGLSMY